MIKIQSIVRKIILREPEANYALSHNFMNMSKYANYIRAEVKEKTKKEVTQTSLVVALSRVRSELKKTKSFIPKVEITNITTKLPLSEIVYENTNASIKKLESLHKKIKIPHKNLYTTTMGTNEITIICSSNSVQKIIKHFSIKPKLIKHNLASVAVDFDSQYLKIPNTIFFLVSILARAKINIEEIVSTYTELIFIVAEKDFNTTVSLLSKLSSLNEKNN